ncbi:hypothetical protein [Catellatospora sp. NPDC049609]|uniref:hypothetical protein n=1 Tax=Catellatospora sp. NPDC049609 TaxID=3155505 RepID=UPI0034456B57
MTDELAATVDALADEMSRLRTALHRAAPGPLRLDVPGRMASLAGAADRAHGAAWSAHLDAASGFDTRLRELAGKVRTAGANYRAADEASEVA